MPELPRRRAAAVVLPLCLLVVVSITVAALAAAQGGAVPGFREVSGHAFGERITTHGEMVLYLERLAAASPRVRVIQQGQSWEERALPLAVVTSPENHARLDEIRADAQRLADPRRISPEEAEAIVGRQPAIVWLGGSIHGFELSGTEGLLKLLERLATGEDAETLAVLESTVVLIDPMLNPDGREAFAAANHQMIGRVPSAERDDWSNDFTGWEGLSFRTGHYFFDTNRDWFAHTQRETRVRARAIQQWRPQVMVDAHEMGPDSEFYFDPAAEPYGPWFPAFARRWFDRFGRAYAEAFDAAGYEYMTRERYNYFYPGYSTSYGSYQGAVGMLFEQGSSRGLALERQDESVRRLSDALEQQYTAAWTAVRTAAAERERLLREYHEAAREAVESGRSGVGRYLIAREEGDPGAAAELVELLLRNGIEVGRLEEEVTLSGVEDREGKSAGSRRFAAGTWVVETAQPRSALVRSLLEQEVALPAEFLEKARARVLADRNPEFYDITAWSLPLLFDVGVYTTTDRRALAVGAVAVAEEKEAQVGRKTGEGVVGVVGGAAGGGFEMPATRPRYSYLIDGRQAAGVAAAWHLRDRGHRVSVLTKPTRIGGRDYAGGTIVVRVGPAAAGGGGAVAGGAGDVHAAVAELAARYRLRVAGADSGYSEAGFPALGSGDSFAVRRPEIAILAGFPLQGYSFGWNWYVLDRQYEIPVTVRRVRSVAETPIHRFDTIVVPDVGSHAALARELGEAGVERLGRWVRDGGTLVAIGGAVDFVREQLKLGALRSWYAVEEEKRKGKEDEKPAPQPIEVPGSIVRAVLDPESWLAAGSGPELPVLVRSSRLYLPPAGPAESDRRAVAAYAPADRLRLSGHLWPESRERLPGALFLYEERIGRGRVIAFAEDPSFRAYWRGSDRLFLNAVVLGPSAP